MNLLLDTNALLWFIGGSSRLSALGRAHIEDPANQKLVSVASIWEIAIKASIGKLTLTQPFDALFPHQLDINGFGLLSIEIRHTSQLSRLPFHHRDPFDRLIIAQALDAKSTVLTPDTAFDSYGVNRIW